MADGGTRRSRVIQLSSYYHCPIEERGSVFRVSIQQLAPSQAPVSGGALFVITRCEPSSSLGRVADAEPTR